MYCLFFSVTVASSNTTTGDFKLGTLEDGPISISKYVSTRSFKDVSPKEVEQARQLVQDSLKRFAVSNEARFEAASRNSYEGSPKSNHPVSTIQITPAMRNAAALLAELDAMSEDSSSQNDWSYSRPETNADANAGGDFWMENLSRLGTQPYGSDSGYKVANSNEHSVMNCS
jgi:hypothetical protein